MPDLIMNVAQARALAADVEELDPQTPICLYKAPGPDGEWAGTIEMRLLEREEGDFLFPDGSTGY